MSKLSITKTLIISLLVAIITSCTSSPQEVVLVSKFVSGEIPSDDTESDLWDEAPILEITLSSQVVFKPRIFDATVKSLTVKSLNNGKEITFLLEWEDPTKSSNILRTEDFADGAAIQHPLSLEREKIWFAMGQPDAVMNIWHWNAEWEEELQKSRDMRVMYPAMGWEYYPFKDDEYFYTGRVSNNFFSEPNKRTSVEDLNAAGLQTLTSQIPDQQNVKGKGVWKDGKWKVIFYRDFQTDDEYDVVFKPTKEIGKLRPIAFAIWDGDNRERNGQKAVSSFYFLDIASPRSLWSYAVGIGAGVVVLGVEVFLLKLLRRKKKH